MATYGNSKAVQIITYGNLWQFKNCSNKHETGLVPLTVSFGELKIPRALVLNSLFETWDKQTGEKQTCSTNFKSWRSMETVASSLNFKTGGAWRLWQPHYMHKPLNFIPCGV